MRISVSNKIRINSEESSVIDGMETERDPVKPLEVQGSLKPFHAFTHMEVFGSFRKSLETGEMSQ